MGCLSNDNDCWDSEQPAHDVILRQQFAMSVHHVTFEDYDRFTFPHRVDDGGWGRGNRLVFNVSWNDAVGYTSWLSDQTGAEYRLPTEAEWEYAARAGSVTRFFWGDEVGRYVACIHGECFGHWEDAMPFNVFRANRFGLYEMVGHGPQWVQDCWNGNYKGAPSDGAAWQQGDCSMRVLRGASWSYDPWGLRSAVRRPARPTSRAFAGFRVVRTISSKITALQRGFDSDHNSN
ncbi:MAG: formylglycine-generating enzyme family protein [Gammaproteobacteria bacterium]|nr:formylglycine-generating enzyme family protein [Gammaproteobacteria bacterium]